MWNKIRNLPITVLNSVKNFVVTLKNDERGLSGVVVAILLILVAVLAIVLIWTFLGDWLRELWEDITGQAGQIGPA